MNTKPAEHAETAGELAASLNTSFLGMEALMDLMAHAPLDHRVRTVGLHALMLLVAEQLAQAHAAMVLMQQGPAGKLPAE